MYDYIVEFMHKGNKMNQMNLDKKEFNHICTSVQSLYQNLNSYIYGQEKLIEEVLCCFLASGNLLITGAPGLAKTTLVRVFSQMLGLSFGRIQFTPDLLPSDITGGEILNFDSETQKRSFQFSKGPIFVNLLLADEINRASPRTQSAMLEAMQEGNVTIGKKSHSIPSPFFVFATQNPFESEGTFPLPEAQMDRFLLHTLVDYPDLASEEQMLNRHVENKLIGETNQVLEKSPIEKNDVDLMIKYAKSTHFPKELIHVVNNMVSSTRPNSDLCPETFREMIWYGAGPRAGISLISASRAFALLEGEETVRWKHIKRMIKPVFRHRIKIVHNHDSIENESDSFIENIIETTEQKFTHLGVK
ncbi:MAG: AAA family ATPase [Zetaproteobacteria bacterium]|nr:AAA family ATPase [Pseudobdellovibrionaceae bacterium]